MASPLTHAVVAVTLAGGYRMSPLSSRYVLLGIACAEIPDLDVMGFWLGVPYESLFGHRGFTHSILFALLMSWALGRWACGWGGLRGGLLWSYLFLTTLSHGVLDALTDGGLGIASFAPFDQARYFFPFHPVKVTPLEPDHALGQAGVAVLVSEAIWIPCGLLAV